MKTKRGVGGLLLKAIIKTRNPNEMTTSSQEQQKLEPKS